MISDADGKQYPWYGSKTEVQTIEGPTLQPTFVTIHMNDNFFPQVTIVQSDLMLYNYKRLANMVNAITLEPTNTQFDLSDKSY